MSMGRVNLGGTAGNLQVGSMLNQGGNSGLSPRGNRQQQMSELMNSNSNNRGKYRGNSRQNQNGHRGNRRNKYDTGYAGPSGEGLSSFNASSRNSNLSSDSQILPQILGPSTNSVVLNASGGGGAGGLNKTVGQRNPYLASNTVSQNSPNANPYGGAGGGVGGLKDGGGGSGNHLNGSGSIISSTVGNSSNNFASSEEHSTSACYSIRGLKPGNPNWINQDNFFIIEGFDNRDIKLFCVLDGHGENGHHVSKRCREVFPQFIRSSNMDMDHAFNMMQNDLNASDIDVKCSGATCVMASIVGTKLNVYNCGDSRAVLGRRNPNGSISAHALSSDHKPDKPEERKRILSCGGHLGCRQVLVNQGGRGPVSMPVGPCRVWYQHRGETLGLAMSRSLGDAIVHKCGVSAEPEVLEHLIDDYDEFAILATDGVWDVVDNNHAVQMVHNFAVRSRGWSPLEAASCICKFARSRWEKLSPMIDDITCIVVKIKR